MMSQVAAEYIYKDTKGSGNKTGTLTTIGTSNGMTTYSMNMGSYILPPIYRVGHKINLDLYIGGNNALVNPYITKIASNRKSFEFQMLSSQVLSGPYKIAQTELLPVGVGIQTWSSQWNRRHYNTTTFAHSDASIRDTSTTGMDERIWRKKANYVYKTPLLNQDGTYQNFNDFDWSIAPNDPNYITLNPNWEWIGEIVNYDIYSKPIETKDINKNYSSIKMGYDLNYPITSVKNANSYEIAYSGAEDLNSISNIGNTSFFGGEVYKNAGTIETTIAHTGKNSLKLIQGHGFNHMAVVGSKGLAYNRKYRASVWIYDNGSTPANAQLYYHMVNSAGQVQSTANEGSLTFANATTAIKAGKWKLLNLDITLTGNYPGYHLVLGCYNPDTSPAYFDDFRFHPLSASMSCNVYDPQSGLVTHVLDGDGFYVRYEYDAKNRIKAIYKETLKGEIKTKEYNYNTPPN